MSLPKPIPSQIDAAAIGALSDDEQRQLFNMVSNIHAELPTLRTARDAAVSFAWEGWPQLGVHPDGPYKGKALSFVDWAARKFGKF